MVTKRESIARSNKNKPYHVKIQDSEKQQKKPPQYLIFQSKTNILK